MNNAEKVENILFLCNNTIDHDNTKSFRMLKSPLVFRRGYTRGFYMPSKQKIIGNIYENKELLESEG